MEIKAGRTVSGDQLSGLHYYGVLDSGFGPGGKYLICGGSEDQDRSSARARGWRRPADIEAAFGASAVAP